MNQNKDFIQATAVVTHLEQQLAEITDGEFAKEEIEEVTTQINTHFNECIKKLNERRDYLLNEVDQLFSQQKAQTLEHLQQTIKGYTEAINTANSMLETNPSLATLFWRGIHSVTIPVSTSKVEVSLPLSFVDAISKHGQVKSHDLSTKTEGSSYTVSDKDIERLQVKLDACETDLKAKAVSIDQMAARLAQLETHTNNVAQQVQQLTPIINSLNTTVGHQAAQIAQNTNYVACCNLSITQQSQRISVHSNIIKPLLKVVTLAGARSGNAEGSGLIARFDNPSFACFNPVDDCLYVSDQMNNTIRKVTLQGDVTTFAALKGDGHFSHPRGIVYFQRDRCFFVCSSDQHTIKKISGEGRIEIVAGSGQRGSNDDRGARATFYCPYGITIDQQTGTLYIADMSNHMIRRVTPQGEVSTLAGNGSNGNTDGIKLNAKFNFPKSLCFYKNILYICDYNNDRIRTLDVGTCEVKTLCEIGKPEGIAITPNGSLVVSSYDFHQVMITNIEGNEPKIIAGTGARGFEDGELLKSTFNCPSGVVFDEKSSTCFAVDRENHRIRKFTLL